MSMITTCPSCQTTFEITTEQLNAHQGDVRCGRCGKVFNAFDSLGQRTPAGQQHETSTPAAEPALPPVQQELPIEDMATHPPADAEPLPAVKSPSVPLDELAEAPQPDEEPAFRHKHTWAWLAGSVITLCLLLGQGAYFYRVEIAANYPALRPTFLEICDVIGCSMPLPRRPELLRIEGSDLESDPAQPTVIHLSSLIINRAKFRQAYPALELTLTNARDEAVARRVFTPQEYLSHGTDVATGLLAGGEVSIRLDLNVGNLNAAGYRLYLFYP